MGFARKDGGYEAERRVRVHLRRRLAEMTQIRPRSVCLVASARGCELILYPGSPWRNARAALRGLENHQRPPHLHR
jgi:hypothetical protein